MVAGGRACPDSSLGSARYHRRVRKLIKLALIVLGIRAFMRWRKSRKHAEAASPAPTPTTADPTDPADELRRKLAESRDEEIAVATPESSVTDRRAEVHETGRAALDEMTTSDEA